MQAADTGAFRIVTITVAQSRVGAIHEVCFIARAHDVIQEELLSRVSIGTTDVRACVDGAVRDN